MFLSTTFAALLAITVFEEAEVSEVLKDTQKKIQHYYVEDRRISDINVSFLEPKFLQQLREADSPQGLAETMSRHLQKFDAHFNVDYHTALTSNSQKKENWYAKLERKNFGFSEVKILEGNVGLLQFWGFADLNKKAKQKVSGVMELLSDVDALIIDLRSNGGGSGEMVQWISSYFVDGKVHLNSFYTRHNDLKQEFWSHPDINEDHFEKVPLYILISDQTFSAAEEFAYNFKHLGRALIVGQMSRGGANPWRWFELQHGFRVGIPTTKAINPITHTNWEGKGVQPHIEVTADKALDEAYRIALKELLEKVTNEYQRQDIELQIKN